MVKRLFFILILLSLSGMARAVVTITSTQYRPNVTLADSGFIHGMIQHHIPQMALTSDGSILIQYLKYVNSATFTPRLLKSSDKGTTWITDNFPLDTTNQGKNSPVYVFGNDVYIMSSGANINDSIMIRKYTGITQGIMDTLNYWKSGDVGRSGLNVLSGDTILFWVCKERGTDTTFILMTRNFSQTATYLSIDSVQFNKSIGPALPLLSGLIRQEFLNEDVFWADSLYGLDTISTAYFSAFNILIYDMYNNPDACVLRDSIYLYAACKFVEGADSLIVFSAYITGTRDTIAGNVSFAAIDTATIEPAANMVYSVGVSGSSLSPQPKFAPLKGTDTCFLIYSYFENQSNLDSANLVMRMSTNAGRTWGSRNIIKAAVDGEQIMRLSASNAISYNGYIEFWAAWSDSIATTGLDSLEVLKVIWDSGVRTAIASGIHYKPGLIMNRYDPSGLGAIYKP